MITEENIIGAGNMADTFNWLLKEIYSLIIPLGMALQCE